METSVIVAVDGAAGLLRPDDGVDDLPRVGTVGTRSSDGQVDLQRLLERVADHATAGSIGSAGGLWADVLRAWEQAVAAGDVTGANRLVALARAIRAVDTSPGIAMIG